MIHEDIIVSLNAGSSVIRSAKEFLARILHSRWLYELIVQSDYYFFKGLLKAGSMHAYYMALVPVPCLTIQEFKSA